MLQKNGKKITASADDFGISKKANENILRLVDAEKLDRVEVMMSRNITPELAKKLIESGVKIDIHLHLLDEKQLDYWQDNPRKIETGAIKRIFVFLYDFFCGKKRPWKAKKEWERQIEAFKKVFGRYPDGLSSHEHIHFFPFYFPITEKICRQFEIPYIRLGKEAAQEKSTVCLILDWLRKIDLLIFQAKMPSSSDLMISFDWFSPEISFEELLSQMPENKTIEIIFHPEKENELEFLEKA